MNNDNVEYSNVFFVTIKKCYLHYSLALLKVNEGKKIGEFSEIFPNREQ